MIKLITLVIASGPILVAPSVMVAQSKWDEAESRIVRISPDSFPTLPSEVLNVLKSMDCLVPQAWGTDAGGAGGHNIITGSFARDGQTDWAALCSVGGSSSIIVVWGGGASCPSPVARALEDRKFLQHTGTEGILYSRGIDTMRPDPAYWSFPEGFAQDSVTHEAIADAFYEKGATAYYCHHGSWLEFQSGH